MTKEQMLENVLMLAESAARWLCHNENGGAYDRDIGKRLTDALSEYQRSCEAMLSASEPQYSGALSHLPLSAQFNQRIGELEMRVDGLSKRLDLLESFKDGPRSATQYTPIPGIGMAFRIVTLPDGTGRVEFIGGGGKAPEAACGHEETVTSLSQLKGLGKYQA